jgi:glucosamine-6-phosphate deaminase
MSIDLMSTIKGSLLEGFYPAGWDLEKIDKLCDFPPESIADRQPWWNKGFNPVLCENVADFDAMMGEAIAGCIRDARVAGEQIAFILPVGPMGMYRWAVYFLKQWKVKCDHVHGFNMDEWADGDGNTVSSDSSEAFQYAMQEAFYGPLGDLTVPKEQRHFAIKTELPTYGEKIRALKAQGAKLVLVFGIGRMCHIAFWEPHFAAEYDNLDDWKKQEFRLGAKLHPLTVEQNAITSFKSRSTLVPARANTIGPGLFLMADEIIGGCDGVLGRGMQWQGMSVRMTLRHEPTKWIPSTFMPTLPGRLFIVRELAGPLVAECN